MASTSTPSRSALPPVLVLDSDSLIKEGQAALRLDEARRQELEVQLDEYEGAYFPAVTPVGQRPLLLSKALQHASPTSALRLLLDPPTYQKQDAPPQRTLMELATAGRALYPPGDDGAREVSLPFECQGGVSEEAAAAALEPDGARREATWVEGGVLRGGLTVQAVALKPADVQHFLADKQMPFVLFRGQQGASLALSLPSSTSTHLPPSSVSLRRSGSTLPPRHLEERFRRLCSLCTIFPVHRHLSRSASSPFSARRHRQRPRLHTSTTASTGGFGGGLSSCFAHLTKCAFPLFTPPLALGQADHPLYPTFLSPLQLYSPTEFSSQAAGSMSARQTSRSCSNGSHAHLAKTGKLSRAFAASSCMQRGPLPDPSLPSRRACRTPSSASR